MRIVAIKGGGVRGLLAARLLERLDLSNPDWAGQADVLAGTSTGAHIALGIAAGIEPHKLVELYTKHSKRIFGDSFWDNLVDMSLGGLSLRGAQYSGDGLREVLVETFGGDRTLGELRQDVLIPAFDLDNHGSPRTWKPKFFSRRHDPDELVVDVAMRTAAAPTYFPTYQGYIDGGVIANDPSVAALAYAIHEGMGDGMAALMVGGVKLFTLGTGAPPNYIEGEGSKDWGGLQWARHLLDVLMDGGMMVPVYQAATVLGDNYYHLNPQLAEEVPLDGGAGQGCLERSLNKLLEIADEENLDEANAWIACHWGKQRR